MKFKLPMDLWFAIAAATGVLVFGILDPAHVFAAGYLALCAYILACVFRRR